MTQYLTTPIGRLRLLAFLEGMSLLILVFIAVPIKYMGDNPLWVERIGPIHGVLFLGFVLLAVYMGMGRNWKLLGTTGILILASFIPFGTFYADWKILKPLAEKDNDQLQESGNAT